MKVSRNAKLAAAVMVFAFGACGEKDESDDDSDEETTAEETAVDYSEGDRTVANLLSLACDADEDGTTFTNCSRSGPSTFWQKDGSETWNEHAQKFTIINAADSANWTVHPGAPADNGAAITSKVIELTQGKPVILYYKNVDSGHASGKHYLTAPVFFENVAWRKVQTAHAEYKAESFNAVETLDNDGDFIEMYFVPMVSGTYDGWCEKGSYSKAEYESLKAAGNVPLKFDGGHPSVTLDTGKTFAEMSDEEKEMIVSFVVSADNNVSLEPKESTRNGALNGNSRSIDENWTRVYLPDNSKYDGKGFWGKYSDSDLAENEDLANATVYLPWVVAVEKSDSNFIFQKQVVDATDANHDYDGPSSWVASGSATDLSETSGITMRRGYAHIFKFEAKAGSTEKHYFTAPELFKTSVFRKAMDASAEIKADYFKAIEVIPAKDDNDSEGWTSLFMSPMVSGDFEVTCTEGDHASMGMMTKVTVGDSAP